MNFLLSKSNILIMILQIFLGFSIYNTSSNIIDNSTSQMSQQEIALFNKPFLVYQGVQSGATIKSSLIPNINANNANSYTPQQISIYLDDNLISSAENIVNMQKYNVYFHYGDNGYIDAVRINTVQ